MQNLNQIQNPQDAPVLQHRTSLRKKGYAFASDDPNYLNSNSLTMNVRYPKLNQSHLISIKNFPTKTMQIVSAGPVDFLVQKETEGVKVWLRNCPHEGAPLETGITKGCEIQCAWHGLKFNALLLNESHSSGYLSQFEIKLSGTDLTISNKT